MDKTFCHRVCTQTDTLCRHWNRRAKLMFHPHMIKGAVVFRYYPNAGNTYCGANETPEWEFVMSNVELDSLEPSQDSAVAQALHDFLKRKHVWLQASQIQASTGAIPCKTSSP